MADSDVCGRGVWMVTGTVCKRMRGRLRRTKEAGGQGAKGWAPYKPTISTGALAERAEKAVAAARVSIAQHRGY